MVRLLSNEGTSTRAIAPIVGVDRTNVTRDLQVVRTAPPERVDYATGEVLTPQQPAEAAQEARTVVGLDGKNYTRPEPAPWNVGRTTSRTPLYITARSAGSDLRKAVERITARIADKLDGIADNIEQVMPLIREALTREAWKPLGYSGATAYVSERFAGAFQRLPRAVRQPIVAELSSAGMSTRAIAPIVGANVATVSRDAKAPVANATPEPERVDFTT